MNIKYKKVLDMLLDKMVEMGGSDLHLKPFTTPKARIAGHIETLINKKLNEEFFETLIETILSPRQKKELLLNKDINGHYVNESGVRFRFNLFLHMRGYAFVFRVIPTKIANIEELQLPRAVNNFIEAERGLVLITGATGSGKSTTMAAIIDGINRTKKKHIITIEDPVEFVHNDKQCIIEQRDIGEHTNSFHDALKSALREDPDVIVIGEMRDLQTIEIALHAANTGHLVFSTLHSLDAKETINRIISVFPTHEQNRIRISLASVLKGILSQRLVKTVDGKRAPAVEILISSDRIKDMILKSRDTEIIEAIEEGGVYGMQSFDQSLFDLYKRGIISLDEALATSTSPHDLKLRISNSEEEPITPMDGILDLKDGAIEQKDKNSKKDSFFIPESDSGLGFIIK